MSKSSNSNSGWVIFVVSLTIAFIVLKLTGYIDWSWWWVWSPMLFPLALVLVIAAIALVTSS